jgi:carbamate kinase
MSGLRIGRATSTVVVAVGGNALQPPGEPGDIASQFAHTRRSLRAVVALAGAGWRIAIVHGNGPQIGDELLRNELARDRRPPLPLGVLVAATAGWIGYMIQQSLQNALAAAGIDRTVVTLVTQVLVEPDHPATRRPDKPIGHVMDAAAARAMEDRFGWAVAEVEGGWRRVVPSPLPVSIVEHVQIRRLVEEGAIVIAAGGGGTPVYRETDGRLEGLDGVVDKDRAAAVLGREIGADALVILTNVDGVYRDWGGPDARLIRRLDAAGAEALLASGELPAGSMHPKVEAALAFVRDGGRRAVIARLDRGLEAVRDGEGTTIMP